MKIPVNLRFRKTSTEAELFDDPYFMADSLQTIESKKQSNVWVLNVLTIERMSDF